MRENVIFFSPSVILPIHVRKCYVLFSPSRSEDAMFFSCCPPHSGQKMLCVFSFCSSHPGQRKRYTSYRRDDSSAMRRQLRLEEEQKAKEARRQKKEDSRAAQLAAYQELLDWEENNLTVEPIKSVIKHSWEVRFGGQRTVTVPIKLVIKHSGGGKFWWTTHCHSAHQVGDQTFGGG